MSERRAEHDSATPQYITIGELWECRECGVEGGFGKFGIMVHALSEHTFGGDNGE